MNNEMKNPYYRLRQYYYIFEELKLSSAKGCESKGLKLSELAEHTELPIEVIRADIACILEASGGDFCLYIGGKSISGQYKHEDERKQFRSDIFAGIYDDADLEWTSNDSKVMLPLTDEESTIMEEVLHFHNHPKTRIMQPFLKKDSYHFYVQDEMAMNEDLYRLQTCIKNKIEAKVWDSTSGAKKQKKIKPISLFYDATINLYAVVYLTENGLSAVRMDKIRFIDEGKCFETPDDIDKRKKIIPNVWGLDFDAKPFNVRVRINRTHGRGNVEKSVRKDLESRVNGKLTEEGDFLIYEDKVYGKEAFIRWLFSYGKSVILEKPVSLRKEIISILQKEAKKMV